ncbi:Eco57I restriction-modification methylase domain-containing protein [Paenibacillus elgii]
MNHKKQNGVYYTPKELADFVVNYVFENYCTNSRLDVLEPSCGDGAFIKAIMNTQELRTESQLNLTAIELDEKELNKIRRHVKRNPVHNMRVNFKNRDYLKFQKKNVENYDLVIGNPPYISYKLLSEEQISLSNEILLNAKIEPAIIKNIWIAFLVSAVLSLKDEGVVCLILPSELLQVKHSTPIRNFLFRNFKSIEIFTFNEIVFEGIEQDTIIFLGSNKPGHQGFKYSTVDNLSNLNVNLVNEISHTKDVVLNEKWTSLILPEDSSEKLNVMKNRMAVIDDYCSSGAGVVTAANESFIVSNETLRKHHLERYSLPIIKKSSFIKELINFSEQDYRLINQSGVSTNLLLFSEKDIELHDENVKSYLNKLIQKQVDQRHKCKQRTKWFIVPSVWVSEGFFFKRSHMYPKVIVNEAKVLVTDTAYRITMRENYNINSLTFSFYNSLTLVYAELYGRFYGGGVLELTPNEFKKLPLPYIEVSKDELLVLDSMFRDGLKIEHILEYTNSVILKSGFGFTDKEISFLNDTRKLLISRRLKAVT